MGNLHGQARPRASAGGQGCGGGGRGNSALAPFTQNTRRSRELAAERVGALSVARWAAGDVYIAIAMHGCTAFARPVIVTRPGPDGTRMA